MSVARPARGVLARCLASTRTVPVVPCHAFHSSAPRPKRKPRFRNVTAEEMGLNKPENLAKFQQEQFPEYTPEQQEELRKQYTPEQLEALKAAEAAVDPKDLVLQGRLRDDPFRPEYIEDYRVLDPRYDVKPPAEGKPEEVKWLSRDEWIDNYGMKMAALLDNKTDKQLTRAMVRALRKVKQGVGQELIDFTEEELKDFEENPELLQNYIVEGDEKGLEAEEILDPAAPDTMTREQAIKLDEAVDAEWKKELEKLEKFGNDAEASPSPLELIEDTAAGPIGLHTVVQPELGKVPGVEGMFRTMEKEDGDSAGEYDEIKRVMGMSLEELRSIYTRAIVRRSVHNQTRLGKIRSMSIMSIAGNGDGRLGIGMAKSTSPEVATLTSRMLALRNMKPIRRYEDRTIYGNVKAKVSGTIVELASRPPGEPHSSCIALRDSKLTCFLGFGLRVPHRIFEMCRACGIHDLAAKMPRSRNPMNSVKATYQALMGQPDPETIAVGRGKKLVDVRKVYYGGSVR